VLGLISVNVIPNHGNCNSLSWNILINNNIPACPGLTGPGGQGLQESQHALACQGLEGWLLYELFIAHLLVNWCVHGFTHPCICVLVHCAICIGMENTALRPACACSCGHTSSFVHTPCPRGMPAAMLSVPCPSSMSVCCPYTSCPSTECCTLLCMELQVAVRMTILGARIFLSCWLHTGHFSKGLLVIRCTVHSFIGHAISCVHTLSIVHMHALPEPYPLPTHHTMSITCAPCPNHACPVC
jgi:hypothetical protein